MIYFFLSIPVLFLILFFVNFYKKKKFVHLFDDPCLVSGLKGSGKDLAFCIVINDKKQNYISNVNYSDPEKPYKCFPFDIDVWKLAGNTYKTLSSGKPYPYSYPYPDGLDYYISDAGIYFPSQFAPQLCKEYSSATMFQALTRHLGDCCVHVNSQAQNRIWDKIREQSDRFIVMNKCKVYRWFLIPFLFRRKKLCKISCYVHTLSETAEKRMIPTYNRFDRQAKEQFENVHGKIEKITFFTRLPYTYDSRRFKKILESGCVDFEH